MKKYLLIALTVLSILFISDDVYAINWLGYNWAATQPNYGTYYEETEQGQYNLKTGSTPLVSAWEFTGFANNEGYYYSGSFSSLPINIGWQYNNPGWCSGQSWMLKGQIFTTTQGGYDFFNDFSIASVSMETDYGSVPCTITPGSVGSDGKNYIDFVCSGTATKNFKLLLTFHGYRQVYTNFMVRNTWSDLACDVSNTDIINAQNQSSQNIINSQNQNSQNIINNQTQNKNDIINNQNQNQAQTNQKLDDLNKNLTDDNVDTSGAGGFFGDYKDNDYGLSSVIKAPLEFIQKLNSNVCTDLTLPIPFVNQNATLPCMKTIYQKHFGSLFTLYQTITTGFIAYWVSVRIFALVKGFKDPEDDKIEVMDL